MPVVTIQIDVSLPKRTPHVELVEEICNFLYLRFAAQDITFAGVRWYGTTAEYDENAEDPTSEPGLPISQDDAADEYASEAVVDPPQSSPEQKFAQIFGRPPSEEERGRLWDNGLLREPTREERQA